jgi:hypothetical protein
MAFPATHRQSGSMNPGGNGQSPPPDPPGPPRWKRRASALRLAFVAAAVTLLTAAAATTSAAAQPASPASASHSFVVDAKLSRAFSPDDFWGGTYTASTGERVTIFVSRTYPVDNSFAQQWADYMASLLHGSELSFVRLYLATPGEVSQICGGTDVLGCYGQDDLIGPAEDQPGITAKSVIAHEYGHHIAAHRGNNPWPAINYGTKRWASYINVCSRARARELFPGAETSIEYRFNPGEAFAEAYRLLNEERLGLPVTDWGVVDESLQPDARALALLAQDVTSPWIGNHVVSYSSTFRRGGSKVRTFSVSTPYDGTLRTSVSAARGERVNVSVHTVTICGQRTVKIRVTRVSGFGTFRLHVSLP